MRRKLYVPMMFFGHYGLMRMIPSDRAFLKMSESLLVRLGGSVQEQ